MKNIKIGANIEQKGGFKSFVPNPFPPMEGFDLDPKTLKNNDKATRLLGKLDGVIKISNEAIDIVDKIILLRERDMTKIQKLGKRASESACLVLPKLYSQPIINNNVIQVWTGFTRAGAQTVIDRFIKMGILSHKDKDNKYGQSFIYKEYVDIFISNE